MRDHLWDAASLARDAADSASRAIQAILKGDAECPPTSARLEAEDWARAAWTCADEALFVYAKIASSGADEGVARAVAAAIVAASNVADFYETLFCRPEGRQKRAWRAYARRVLEEGVAPAVQVTEQAIERLLRPRTAT